MREIQSEERKNERDERKTVTEIRQTNEKIDKYDWERNETTNKRENERPKFVCDLCANESIIHSPLTDRHKVDRKI